MGTLGDLRHNLYGDLAESRDVSKKNADVAARMVEFMKRAHTPSEEFPLQR